MTKTKRKGLSLSELVISLAVLSVIMLGAAGFTANFMDVSYTSSKQMVNVNQARSILESITREIANAAYIYPAGTQISLSISGGASVTINTDSAVALLYYDLTSDSYGFTAFYTVTSDGNSDLYQFTASPGYDWDVNTSPALELLSFTGTSSKLMTEIDTANTSLNYILNYENGINDDILEGEISGTATNSAYALIKGIDWELAQSNIANQTIKIMELSRNVPRFTE